MTLTAPQAPAMGLDFDFAAAVRAILAGSPGVLYYAGAAPRFAAVDPLLTVTLYADRLAWRRHGPRAAADTLHAARLPGRAGLELLQSLWLELDAAESDAAPADSRAARPHLPVWFSYELGENLEPAALRTRAALPPAIRPARPHLPLGGFVIPRAMLSADTGLEEASLARGRRLLRCFDRLTADLPPVAPDAADPAFIPPVSAPAAADADRGQFLAAVDRVQQYIAAGDVYQVNVTRRETFQHAEPAGAWFAATLQRHPAAQASFWSCIDTAPAAAGRRHFLSFTPERLLAIDRAQHGGWDLLSSPIKGTRPRPPQAAPADLEALAADLMRDPKELAELNMIIDMTRNDLGRVADLGSVRVLTAGRIDRLPFVFHRVADVAAHAARPVSLVSLLSALFPGASITGAPKIRAMQIIRELEPTPRGIYCGVLGWLSAGRQLDWALAIRTLEARTLGPAGDGPWQGRFGVGAGIVADSIPDREWQETLAKSRGIVL